MPSSPSCFALSALSAVCACACALGLPGAAQAQSHPPEDAPAHTPMAVDAMLPQAERAPRLSNKWRLEFSGAAESAGSIVLEVRADGRPAVLVTAEIERNDGENRVARKVKTALDRQAGAWVDAELDDGEDVLVKRRLFKPRVSVRLVSMTVKDVRINFDRE